VLKMGPPYVDFALWGPHGNRIVKKVRMQGTRIRPDGSLGAIEIAGPGCFSDWLQCYGIFRTGAIMMEAILPVYLDQYSDLIKRYSERYSASVWPLIYQSDVRARLEQTERLRRLGASLPDDPAARCRFVADKPWNWVWKALAEERNQ
jgi:hypothetical protein